MDEIPGDDYLDTCERLVRQIECVAGDLGLTRPQLDQLSIEWYGQEPYKLPLGLLNAFLLLLVEQWKEIHDAEPER